MSISRRRRAVDSVLWVSVRDLMRMFQGQGIVHEHFEHRGAGWGEDVREDCHVFELCMCG